jgi:hypothetical protein
MRTWFNALLPEHHAPAASFERGLADSRHAKKRVPVPVTAGTPYALAKETGCPEGITARRTLRALA